MKTAILCNGREKKAKLLKICDFGAVEIYNLDIKLLKSQRARQKQIRKIAKTLRDEGISLCTGEKDFSELSFHGITVVSDKEGAIRKRAGQAAILFSEMHGLDRDFLIRGGAFSDVIETAKILLKRKRHVYINNPAFDLISDELFYETGAVVRNDAPGNAVTISLDGCGAFCSCGEIFADFKDFGIRVSRLEACGIENKNMPALVLILEKSGFLAKNCVKIEYFLK